MNNSKKHTYFAIQHNLNLFEKNPHINGNKFYKRLFENKKCNKSKTLQKYKIRKCLSSLRDLNITLV